MCQNRSLLKMVKVTLWKRIIVRMNRKKFLLAYRSNPHRATGESLAELPFSRKLRTKLPELEEVHRSRRESEAKDRDSEYKLKRKSSRDLESSGETVK